MGTALYLHGLASSPGSAKAAWMGPRFEAAGWQFLAPDLNVPSFEGMRISAQVAAIEAAVAPIDDPVVLIGSSLGSLATLSYASRHPDCVERIVLLAPALGFVAAHLAELAGSSNRRWMEEGALSIEHYDGVVRPLGSQLLEEARELAVESLETSCPVLVIHGTDDEVVPFETSANWVQGRANTRLFPVARGDHSLLPWMDLIWTEMVEYLGLRPSAT